MEGHVDAGHEDERAFAAELGDAPLDLGARPAKVFFRITLPLIVPAIMSGWLLAFTLSWDDVVVSQFVAGPGSTTLPMKVFASVRMGISPKINALATLLVSAVSIAAPADGVVLTRAVDPGNAVAASLQAVTLFSVAEDLAKLRLWVYVDEADVGTVAIGQSATFTVSAYPARKYPARITRVGFGSTITDNVVTYLTYLAVLTATAALFATGWLVDAFAPRLRYGGWEGVFLGLWLPMAVAGLWAAWRASVTPDPPAR